MRIKFASKILFPRNNRSIICKVPFQFQKHSLKFYDRRLCCKKAPGERAITFFERAAFEFCLIVIFLEREKLAREPVISVWYNFFFLTVACTFVAAGCVFFSVCVLRQTCYSTSSHNYTHIMRAEHCIIHHTLRRKLNRWLSIYLLSGVAARRANLLRARARLCIYWKGVKI